MQRPLITKIFVATLTLFLAVPFAGAQSVVQKDSTAERLVGPGVIHRQIVRGNGPWNIHVVAIDLKNGDLRITSARAHDSVKGRETTNSIARRKASAGVDVVAAINADFFNMQTGENDLSQIIDGEIVYAVRKPVRAQFGIGASGKPYIEMFRFDGEVLTRRDRIPLHAVNNLKDSSATVLLTPYIASYTPNRHEHVRGLGLIQHRGDTLIVIAGDTLVHGVLYAMADSLFLLRTARGMSENVAVGDTLQIVQRFTPVTERLETLVGGLPRLLVDGRNFAATDSLAGLTGRFTETRHPRTGVGFSRDSTVVYFVTVDGRQASSVGMSLAEFANVMIEVGCFQALNLDGGGSTTMVVDGAVVNLPSDPTGERPVANVLMVVKKKTD